MKVVDCLRVFGLLLEFLKTLKVNVKVAPLLSSDSISS